MPNTNRLIRMQMEKKPMPTTKPFIIGQSYQTKAGTTITITEEANRNNSYWCCRGSDGIWRYNRESDRGRVTASPFDMSDPRNLIPEQAP